MTSTVFLLWHAHDIGDSATDNKLIGVYSSNQEAEAAKQRKLQYPGFRDAPEGFQINAYEVDRDQWSEGYVTV
jgi:homoserine kinase type II